MPERKNSLESLYKRKARTMYILLKIQDNGGGKMHYMVHIVLPLEAGNKLDASGGLIPVINQIKERFKPQVVVSTVTLREFWLIINVEDPLALGELSLISVRKFGSYPEFTPILEGEELDKMVIRQE